MYRFVRQNGFGGVSTLVVVLIMAVIGASAGLVVRANRHSTHQAKADAPTIATPISTTTPYTPPGYTRYSDNLTGFSVAYPSGWGVLQSFGQGNGDGSTVATALLQPGQPDAVAGEQNAFAVGTSISGKLAIQYESGVIASQPSAGSYAWRVVSGSAVGSGSAVDLPLHKNQNGVSYYDASTAGEDGTACSYHTYIFVSRRGLVSVLVPQLCPAQTGGYIDKTAKAAYLRQLKAVIDSVSLF